MIINTALFKEHVERLKASLSSHSHDTICEFLTKNTFLKGDPFSFEGHEYQEQILKDKSQEKVIIKSAQLGISEMSARMALAMAVLRNGFSTIYTLPSALAAQNFMRTRIDPVINTSPYLSGMVHSSLDNASVKKFGDSYVYLKGAQVDTQAISTPADMLVVDEVDNSSQDVITLFESRLIHSSYGYIVRLSTPSIPNYGIDLYFQQSRRHFNMVKCVHCGHWCYPSYIDHCRIPDFSGSLDSITKSSFSNPDFRWQEAYLACPKCAKPLDLAKENREWVCENPTHGFVAAGYRVSPFDCPSTVKTSSLVRASVNFERKQDFYNQRLGLSLDDKDSALLEDELRKCFISEHVGSTFSTVMGLDMGATCYLTIAAVLPDNQLIIVHREGVPMHDVVRRRAELARMYRVRVTVVDHGPMTETVYRMQQEDRNLYAGIYVRSKNVEFHKIREQDEDKKKGKEEVKAVLISRDRCFDLLMDMFRNDQIKCVSSDQDELWVRHLMDQKRVKEFSGDDLVYVWRKTQGEDHYHHSLLYCLIASRIIGVSRNYGVAFEPILGKFALKQAS